MMKMCRSLVAGLLACVALMFGGMAMAVEPERLVLAMECAACATSLDDSGAVAAVAVGAMERRAIARTDSMTLPSLRSYMRADGHGYLFASIQRHERIDRPSPC